MDKFFKSLKYHIVKFFANILIGIGYILVAYPVWGAIIFKDINFMSMVLSWIFSFIIAIIGSIIKEDNEKEYNKEN